MTGPAPRFEKHRILKLRFTVPDELTDDDVHELGERVATDLFTDEPVTFDGTEVADES